MGGVSLNPIWALGVQKMVRGWAAMAVGLAASVAAWAAVDASRYDRFGLAVTFPEKWIVGSGEEPVLLLSRSTDPVSLANCVATGEEVSATRAFTQQQINEGLAAPFGEDFWRQIYTTANMTPDVKAQGARLHASGVMIQEAQFDLSKTGSAPETKMSIHQAIFVRPGATISVACSARAIAYPNQKAMLSAVIESVRFFPPSAPVASAEPPAPMSVKDGPLTAVDAKKALGGVAKAGDALMNLNGK